MPLPHARFPFEAGRTAEKCRRCRQRGGTSALGRSAGSIADVSAFSCGSTGPSSPRSTRAGSPATSKSSSRRPPPPCPRGAAARRHHAATSATAPAPATTAPPQAGVARMSGALVERQETALFRPSPARRSRSGSCGGERGASPQAPVVVGAGVATSFQLRRNLSGLDHQ